MPWAVRRWMAPHTTHWWGISKECVTCHVHQEPYGGPEQPVNSGHTFEPNMRACLPCHDETTATLLVEGTREETTLRLATIAHYFTPGDSLYVDPSGLGAVELARYEIAKFNYEYVTNDRSFGSHNAPYTHAVLSETEEFLGIDPWPTFAPGDGSDPAQPSPSRSARRVEVP